MSLLRRIWDSLFGPRESEGLSLADESAVDGCGPAEISDDGPEAGGFDDSDEPAGRRWWLSRADEQRVADDLTVADGLYDELEGALATLIESENPDLPRLPHVADRALVMLQRDTMKYGELARVIVDDPGLTAQLLRVANSAYYGGVAEIRSLEAAFTRLGQRTLRGVILNSALRTLSLRVGGAEKTLGERIWQRAVASAVIMESLAARVGLGAEDAFLFGLLHDVGSFLVMTVTHQHTLRTGVRVPAAVFERLATPWHERAGQRLASAWNLPAPLPEIIADHHRLPDGEHPLRAYRLALMFADMSCALLGFAPYHPYELFSTPCAQQLGLSDTPDVHALLRVWPEQIAARIELA